VVVWSGNGVYVVGECACVCVSERLLFCGESVCECERGACVRVCVCT